MKTVIVRGQESWQISTPAMNASVTVLGGMMAPVSFYLPDGRVVQPYYVSPWQDEAFQVDLSIKQTIEPPVLVPLRGDFFCLPFGGNNRVGTEDHLPHGESAWKSWRFVSCEPDATGDGPALQSASRLSPGLASGIDKDRAVQNREPGNPATRLVLEMEYQACSGSIQKSLFFGQNQTYVGTEHRLSGFSGAYPLGHHAILEGSIEGKAIWKLFFPPFDLGLTDPDAAKPYERGEYHALAGGVSFRDCTEVPTRWKEPGHTDLTVFPARSGFIDIAGIYRKTSALNDRKPGEPRWFGRLGWTVAVNGEQGYLWYSIKDQSLLPATIFWMENQGRHASPWLGRNSCIGIEETCTFMAAGRSLSLGPNQVNQQGIPSMVQLYPASTQVVRTIQGVLPIPNSDTHITGLGLDADGCAAFTTESGDCLTLPVSPAWVLG